MATSNSSSNDAANSAGATNPTDSSARLGDGASQPQVINQSVSTDDRRCLSATQLIASPPTATTTPPIPATSTLSGGHSSNSTDIHKAKASTSKTSVTVDVGKITQSVSSVQTRNQARTPTVAIPLFQGMRITPPLSKAEEEYWRASQILKSFVHYFDKHSFADDAIRLSACEHHATTFWATYTQKEPALKAIRIAAYGRQTKRPAAILAGYYKRCRQSTCVDVSKVVTDICHPSLSASDVSVDTTNMPPEPNTPLAGEDVIAETVATRTSETVATPADFVRTTPNPLITGSETATSHVSSSVLPAGIDKPALVTLNDLQFMGAVRMAEMADLNWFKLAPVQEQYDRLLVARDHNREAADHVQAYVDLLQTALDNASDESGAIQSDNTRRVESIVQLRHLLDEQRQILSRLRAYSTELQRVHYQVYILRKERRRRRRDVKLTELLAENLSQVSAENGSSTESFRQQFLRDEIRLRDIYVEHGLDFVRSHIGRWVDDQAERVAAGEFPDGADDTLLSADRGLLRKAQDKTAARSEKANSLSNASSPYQSASQTNLLDNAVPAGGNQVPAGRRYLRRWRSHRRRPHPGGVLACCPSCPAPPSPSASMPPDPPTPSLPRSPAPPPPPPPATSRRVSVAEVTGSPQLSSEQVRTSEAPPPAPPPVVFDHHHRRKQSGRCSVRVAVLADLDVQGLARRHGQVPADNRAGPAGSPVISGAARGADRCHVDDRRPGADVVALLATGVAEAGSAGLAGGARPAPLGLAPAPEATASATSANTAATHPAKPMRFLPLLPRCPARTPVLRVADPHQPAAM